MTKDVHPLSINILKYQYYNFDFFNCQEVVLFETIVVLGGVSFRNKEEFFHSTQTLSDKTGIKRHSVDKILKRFQGLGIIDYENKGMPKVKHFKMNWSVIFDLLPQIYQFDELKKHFNGTTKPLTDYFKLLGENVKEKNINKNTKEEYKEEYNDNAIANRDVVVDNFKLFLDELFEFKDSPRKEFESIDLMKALNFYTLDVIKDYVTIRYQSITVFDMRTFFKFSKSGRLIGLDEYYKREDKHVIRFIEELKDVFQNRIRIYNNENEGFKESTPLPVKGNVKNKMSEVLKVKEEIEIKNAFIAYADDVLNMRVKPTLDALSYFLKKENDEYPVIDNFQLKFITSYSKQ